MPVVRVGETLHSAFLLYREALPILVRRVLPVIAIAQTIELLPLAGNPLLLLLLALFSWLALAWASAFGLHIMLRLRDGGALSSPSVASLALFALALAYVTLASSLGFFLLVVPAFIVASAAILAPVFALEQRQGPFEAAASSTDRAKGNLLPISGVVLVIWLALLLAGVLFGLIAEAFGTAALPLAYVGSVALGFAALFHYAVIVVLHERLPPNPPLQGTPAGEPAAPLS